MAVEWYPEIASWDDVDFDWENGLVELQHIDYRVFVALMKGAMERASALRNYNATFGVGDFVLNINPLIPLWNFAANPYAPAGRINYLGYICQWIDVLIPRGQYFMSLGDVSGMSDGDFYASRLDGNKLAQNIGYADWSALPQITWYEDWPGDPEFLYPLSYSDKKLSEWITTRYKIINQLKYAPNFATYNARSKTIIQKKDVDGNDGWNAVHSRFMSTPFADYTYTGPDYMDGKLHAHTADLSGGGTYDRIQVERFREVYLKKPYLKIYSSSEDNSGEAYVDMPLSSIKIYALPITNYGARFDSFGRITQANKYNLLDSLGEADYNENRERIIDCTTYTDAELAAMTRPPFDDGNTYGSTAQLIFDFFIEDFTGPNGFKFKDW